jgi:hypothetical protein
MTSPIATAKVGDRVIVSVSGVHGTVKGLTGTGALPDVFTEIINVVVTGDDQVEYTLPLTALIPEAAAIT